MVAEVLILTGVIGEQEENLNDSSAPVMRLWFFCGADPLVRGGLARFPSPLARQLSRFARDGEQPLV